MDKHGYYKILGVSTNATTKEIKSAYKKLAMKYHTDSPEVSRLLRNCKTDEEREKMKKEFEKKFSDLSTAYAVLSNDDKRKKYDLGQDDEEYGFGAEDMRSSIFNSFFGGFGGFGRRTQAPSNRIEKIQITLRDAFNGVQKKYKVTRKLLCRTCNAIGYKNTKKCTRCDGRGVCVEIRNMGGMYMQTERPCGECKERGFISSGPACTDCSGKGYIKETNTVEVNIEKGVTDKHPIVFKGMGDEEEGLGVGDLVFVVLIKPDPEFTRIGEHLYIKMKVPIETLLLGTPFEIETIDKKKVFIEVPDMHKVDILKELLLVNNLGMPSSKHSRGHLFIHITPIFPDRRNINKLINTLSNPKSEKNMETISGCFIDKKMLEDYIEDNDSRQEDTRFGEERSSQRCNAV